MSVNSATPLPLPGRASGQVIFFGGTFDPPHRAHVELPARIREELERRAGRPGTAWLVYVPVARSPHKAESPLAPDADRVEMLRLALGGTPRAAVWTDEIDRAAAGAGEASYTVDTLTRARDLLGAACPSVPPALRLLIGADQALGFHRWRAPREIIRLAPPVVMLRGDVGDAEALVARLRAAAFWTDAELAAWREAMIPVGLIDVSATAVREALSRRDWGAAAGWVAPGVLEHIQRSGLYQRPT